MITFYFKLKKGQKWSWSATSRFIIPCMLNKFGKFLFISSSIENSLVPITICCFSSLGIGIRKYLHFGDLLTCNQHFRSFARGTHKLLSKLPKYLSKNYISLGFSNKINLNCFEFIKNNIKTITYANLTFRYKGTPLIVL